MKINSFYSYEKNWRGCCVNQIESNYRTKFYIFSLSEDDFVKSFYKGVILQLLS